MSRKRDTSGRPTPAAATCNFLVHSRFLLFSNPKTCLGKSWVIPGIAGHSTKNHSTGSTVQVILDDRYCIKNLWGKYRTARELLWSCHRESSLIKTRDVHLCFGARWFWRQVPSPWGRHLFDGLLGSSQVLPEQNWRSVKRPSPRQTFVRLPQIVCDSWYVVPLT